MSIELLSTPKWTTGTSWENQEIDQPSWPDVEAAIRDLDGAVSQEVYMHPHRGNLETWLTVGGGGGQYIVTGSINNDEFPTYVTGKEHSRDVPLVIGGQLGKYPDNWIVDLEEALRIAKTFYDAGGAFDCGIPWSYERLC